MRLLSHRIIMEAQLTVAKQVLERAEELHGADDPKLTAPLKQLGSIYNALGDYKSATEVCVCVSLSLSPSSLVHHHVFTCVLDWITPFLPST